MPKPLVVPTRYQARNRAVVGYNQSRFFNRPLYIANTAAFVLAGDRPVLRFASGDTVHGTFLVGVVRQGRGYWLHAWDKVETEFRAAHVRWVARDRRLSGLAVTLEVVALGEAVGLAAKLTCRGARPGDELVWAYGGAVVHAGKNLNWELDPHRDPTRTEQAFDSADCAGNRVALERDGFTLAPAEAKGVATTVRCSARGVWRIADAAEFADLGALLRSTGESGESKPLTCGCCALAGKRSVTWSLIRDTADDRTTAEIFAAGLARSRALASRIVVETPEPRLDAAAAMLPAALDGAWYPPVFHHGAMLWNIRFPGWRTVFGGTVAGWHDRVRAQAEFYFASQVKSQRNRGAAMDEKYLLTIPAPGSRFYGRGRIAQDQAFYNMQTQFFDQVIHAWRWTGDARLARQLRPALELHLEWVRECFDPDGNGLYESVINVWPTDSVWYGGGGGAEETAYAYRGHLAARDLARLAHDVRAVRRHERRLALIHAAFQEKLWITAKGHAGLYREQGADGRLHEDAWLYGVFLPIDAGLVDAMQAAQSLHYAERALQNDPMPAGGRQVWTSNFVPGMWSVRERWPGDNYHLALAYFQSGLAADGWDVFRGGFLHTAFDQLVPGDFGAPAGGTDFGDCAHMFARTMVEGLFGYVPDRANGIVRIAPQFPAQWPRAALRTPDVSLRFARRGSKTTLTVELAEASAMEINLPVSAREIATVTVNGRKVRWRECPGFGSTIVQVKVPAARRVTLGIKAKAASAVFPPLRSKGRVGGRILLRAKGARILAFADPQGALADATIRGGAIVARLNGGRVGGTDAVMWQPRFCTVQARVAYGATEQWRLFRVEISDPVFWNGERAKDVRRVPAKAKWTCLELGKVFNGDIRTIYQQDYVSPRPATVSARIGRDGYSPWTFPHWNSRPPAIALDGVVRLREKSGARRLRTPQGVPFAWQSGARNVAFASRWDNWPQYVVVPVGERGVAIWFLVCGSTNPMQGRIANAVLRLRYADGVEDTLTLVPPFNYWNLSPIDSKATSPGQAGREDYTASVDRFCLPQEWPQTVQLGQNCRAMLLNRRLRPEVILESVTLEALSQEVVVGLMGLTVMKA